MCGQVALQQRQHGFGLRVTEAGVELHHLRPLRGQHQPGVQHAAKEDAFGPQTCQGALYHLAPDGLQVLGAYRKGADDAHAAGHGAGVTLANRLVVLAGRSQGEALAVGQRQHRDFLPGHEFLNHHGCVLLLEDGVQRRLGLLTGLRDGHTLAGPQPRVLDDGGQRLGVQVGQRRFQRLEGLVRGGGHAVAHHKGLAPGLVAFYLRGGAAGTEGGNPGGLQVVGQALRQVGFRTDNDQLGPALLRQGH